MGRASNYFTAPSNKILNAALTIVATQAHSQLSLLTLHKQRRQSCMVNKL